MSHSKLDVLGFEMAAQEIIEIGRQLVLASKRGIAAAEPLISGCL